MNNTEFLSNQYPDDRNRPQSLIKLPIIFTLIMVFCSICLSAFYYIGYSLATDDDYLSAWNLFQFLSNGVVNQCLNYSIYYFCIGLIMCIDQKMHQVNLCNILIIFIISVIFLLVNYLFTNLIPSIYRVLREQFSFNNEAISIFFPLISFFLSLLKLLILVGLFKLIGTIGRHEKRSYAVVNVNQKNLFAWLFVIIFCLPSMMVLLQILSSVISGFLFAYMGGDIFGDNLLITINLLLLPALSSFLAIMVIFVIFYFSVKSCFIKKFNAIPLKLLFKSVGWAYLYSIVFNIVIGLVYFMVSFSMISNTTGHNSIIGTILLMVVFALVFAVISIVGSIIFCRKSVRKYFS